MIDEVPQTIQDLELLAKGPFWLKEVKHYMAQVGSQYDDIRCIQETILRAPVETSGSTTNTCAVHCRPANFQDGGG